MAEKTERFKDEIPDWDADYTKWQAKFRAYVNNVDSRNFSIMESLRLAPYVLPSSEIYTDGSEKKFRILSDAVFLSRTNNTVINVALDTDLVLIPGAIIGAYMTPGAVGTQNTEFQLYPNGVDIDPNVQVFGAVDGSYGIYWFNGARLGVDTGTFQLFSHASISGAGNTVSVTSSDTTPDFLYNKLSEGNGIGLTVTNPGGDEGIEVSFSGSADDIPDGVTNVMMTSTERSNLADAFLKTVDTSDDITEGTNNLFLTTSERSDIADAFLKNTDTSDDVVEGTVQLFLTASERTDLADAFLKSSDDSDDIVEGVSQLFLTSAERTNIADSFLKTTDDSDDITEGAVNLFLTAGERTDIADSFLKSSNTSDDITEGTSNLFLTTSERSDIADAYLKSVDDASDIDLITGNDATLVSVQDLINNYIGRGAVSGFTFSDNLDGTCNIGAGKAFLHTGVDGTDAGFFETTSSTLINTLVTNNANYIYLEYNAGSPQILSTTNPASILNAEDKIVINIIFRDGTDLHPLNAEYGWQSFIAKYTRKQFAEAQGEGNLFAKRAFGGIISATGTRNLICTEAEFWASTNRKPVAAKNTATGDTMYQYYGNTGVGFTKSTGVTQINNTQYFNGTGLSSLSNNWFTVRYIYQDLSGDDLTTMFGTGQYASLAAAEAETVPTDLPAFISQFAILFGRVIVQQNNNTMVVESRWINDFNFGLVTTHPQLGDKNGETAYQHVNSLPVSGQTGTQILESGFVSTSTKKFEVAPYGLILRKTWTNTSGLSTVFGCRCGANFYVWDFTNDNVYIYDIASGTLIKTIAVTDIGGSNYPVCVGDTVVLANSATALIINNNNFSVETRTITGDSFSAYRGICYVNNKILGLGSGTVSVLTIGASSLSCANVTTTGITGTQGKIDCDSTHYYILDVSASTYYIRKYLLSDNSLVTSSSQFSGVSRNISIQNNGNIMLNDSGGLTRIIAADMTTVLYSGSSTLNGHATGKFAEFYRVDTANIYQYVFMGLTTTQPRMLDVKGAHVEFTHDKYPTRTYDNNTLVNAIIKTSSQELDRLGCNVQSIETSIPASPNIGSAYLMNGGTSAYEKYVIRRTIDSEWETLPRGTGATVTDSSTGIRWRWNGIEWLKADRCNYREIDTSDTVLASDEGKTIVVLDSRTADVLIVFDTGVLSISGMKFAVYVYYNATYTVKISCGSNNNGTWLMNGVDAGANVIPVRYEFDIDAYGNVVPCGGNPPYVAPPA